MSFLNDPHSPIWNLLRLAVVMAVLAGFLAFGYKNGWSTADYTTVIGLGASLGLFDFVKKLLTLPDEGLK